jgi:hypothetical protein
MTKSRLLMAGLLLLATFNSSWYFLGIRRAGIANWLMFNACAVANITFLLGVAVYLVCGTRALLYVAVLPLFFFGTGGLFVFAWSGPMLVAQISHLLMTANLALLVADMVRLRDFKAASIGMLIGTCVFSVFLAVQQDYVRRHPAEAQALLGMSPGAN